MAGPWEQYQTPQAVPDAAPWMAYQGQGEHGYAPAPPEPPSDATQRAAIAAGYPEASVAAYLDEHPLTVPLPAAVTDLAAYREPGTDLTDIEPREGAATRIVGAIDEGFRKGASAGTDIQGQPLLTGLMRQGGGVLGAVGGAFGQGAYEIGNLWSPEAGRDAVMGLQSLTPLMAIPQFGLTRGATVRALAEAPRISPMMEAFDRAEAMRAEQPSRPAPPDPVASNIARVQSQIGVRDAPPPSPDMTATPADRAPGFVPRVNVDPLTGEATTTQVPTDLRLRAAIEAVPPEAPPGFVPPGEPGPSVRPGAAGPETIPPYASPDAGTPPPETGAPRSAGAAGTPYAAAAMTPEQEALYGSVADKQWLYKSMQPGVADNTEYVKGINPTMAQREQTVNAARETKTARNLSKEADQAERELLDEHNTIRKNEFQNVAGSDVTQGIAIDAAEKNIDDALGKAFNAGGTVDPQPITRAITAELNAPSGKLPPVKAVLKVVSDALQKSDGAGLETDPTQVYGVRRVINYLQSKNAIAENPAYGSPDVQAALIRVKNAIDAQMEPAAPGFTDAIANYAKARQAFDANEALQKAEPKLYDDKGRMQYSRFHRFMNEVIQSRDPRAPLNPYQSFTEAQMNRLKSLHDDLFRVANAEDLARAKGSDTAMNFMDAIKEAAQGVPGTLAAGLAGHVIGGPAGIVMGPAIKQGVQGVFTRRAERAATQKMQRLLRPDPVQYPTRPNPLFNPDAAP
jgi:hypothetical protein